MPLVFNTTHNHLQRLGTLFALLMMWLSNATFALNFEGDFVQGGMVVVKDADVIAAWHPRYNDDALLNWITSLLKQQYLAGF